MRREVVGKLYKYEGLGNDFLIYVDNTNSYAISSEDARLWCHRNTGIGADGLIRVAKSNVDDADLVMELLNADGSRGAMSGNGVRCVVHAAIDTKLVLGNVDRSAWVGQAIRVRTDVGIKLVTIVGTEGDELWCNVEMGDVSILGEGRVSVGNPHEVQIVASIQELVMATDPGKPEVNVEVVWVGPEANTLTMRVWERGVGETLACGTGSCAAAAYAHSRGLVGIDVRVVNVGGPVDVALSPTAHSDRWLATLTGPSNSVAAIAGIG